MYILSIDNLPDIISPSKSSNKKRRRKGEGSGHIYYRTVIRGSKKYQQAYYQWRENEKQRTKYIPKKLLDRVIEAESSKLPVTEILEILQGGLDKCSSKILNIDKKCSSKINPPCTKKKRNNGYGGGYIEYRKVKRNHKIYIQCWFHWEYWNDGDRLEKKSKYIPKRLVQKVERMNNEKVVVRKILAVLKVIKY